MTQLPIRIDAPLSFEEQVMLLAMEQYAPHTKMKPGDHVALKAPPHILNRISRSCPGGKIPSIWEIRFVISAWAYELYCSYAAGNSFMEIVRNALDSPEAGYDSSLGFNVCVVEELEGEIVCNGILSPNDFTLPIVYAHGWPHGAYPDTAAWFFNPGWLRKINIVNPTPQWEPILDEFKTKYGGLSMEGSANFGFDIAPDFYGDAVNLKRPLTHEEGSFHTASLLGLEEYAMTPLSVDPSKLKRPLVFDSDDW